ncbi:hypothetical protein JTE90_023787 [Oedothorax gibbosus]|uniref:Uncharacterized protein n=1 Tax=Oedothorax gibbosus TaxID=931172 RepID=A0AAV6UUG9_9ARAC|nr:hypothetical protein JTE90_023787 [Oedothorax gibbosus]
MDESRLNIVRTHKNDDEEDDTAYLSESESEDWVKPNELQQMDDPKLQNIISALGEDSNEETDAKYSEQGLPWGFLKGKDRVNVSALLNAAKCLRLVPHLALAEIKQCFSRMDISDEVEESENYDRGDIGESQIIFHYWVDVSNRKVDRSYLWKVADNEICWTKGIRSFKPFRTESIVQVSTAETLAKLQNEYGVEWFIDMLDKWGKDKNLACDINQVDDFIYVFLKNKGELKIAERALE